MIGLSLHRAGWGLADQALSSLTNFALGIVVARTVDPEAFGAFSLAFAAYIVGLGLSRAISTLPLVVRYSATPVETWRRGVAASGGVALLAGCVSAVVSLALAALTGGSMRESLTALAVVFPGLLLQDSWRHAFFARGRDNQAFLNDLVWAVALVPAIWLAHAVVPGSITGLMLAWGIAAGVAGVTGIAQARIAPRPGALPSWLAEHRSLWPRYVGEFAISMSASQVSLFVLGALAGLGAAGTLRAGQLLLGPLNILYQGLGLVAVPAGVGLLRRSGRHLRQAALAMAAVLSGIALAWGVAMYVLPTSLGTLILGANWAPAHGVVLPLAIALAGSGVSAGAAFGVRALAAASQGLRATSGVALLSVGGGVAGALVAGATGVAWGQAAANWTGAGIWWRAFAGASPTVAVEGRRATGSQRV